MSKKFMVQIAAGVLVLCALVVVVAALIVAVVWGDYGQPTFL